MQSENEDLKTKQDQLEKEIHYLETANSNLMQELNCRVSEIENFKKWNGDLKKDLEVSNMGFPVSLSTANHEHVLKELTKGLEIYRSRLVTMISTIRGTDMEKQTEIDLVIEELTQEMQTYSMLLIKTQMTLDFKEKEVSNLRLENEQISLSCKDSIKIGHRRTDEQNQTQLQAKDQTINSLEKRVSEVIREKKALQKEFDEINRKNEDLEGKIMNEKLESDLLKEHIERLNESLKEQERCFDMERSELELQLAGRLEQLRIVGVCGEGEEMVEMGVGRGRRRGEVEGGGGNLEVALLKKKMGCQETNILNLNMNIESISKENFDLQNKLKDSACNLEASRNEFEN
jgi:chromosome segregation ATPase